MSKEKKARTKKKLNAQSICAKIVKEMKEKEQELLAVRPDAPVIIMHDIDEAPNQLDLFDYVGNTVHQYKVHQAVCDQFEGLMDLCVRYDEIIKLWGMKELGDIDGKKFFDAVKLVIFSVGNVQGLSNKFLRDFEATAQSVAEQIEEHNAKVLAKMQNAESIVADDVKEGE